MIEMGMKFMTQIFPTNLTPNANALKWMESELDQLCECI
jgi:hypothetical protein